jgi:hypothetical protein
MVRTMMWNKVKYLALVILLVAGLVGFGMGRWLQVNAGPETNTTRVADGTAKDPGNPPAQDGKKLAVPAVEKDAGRPDDAGRPGQARRREAVIRMPSGTFVKEVDVPPYGSGRITWTYEEDHVNGLIEVSVMGFEVELATEAEISLSSNGTIYGLITGVRINHVRIPQNEEFGDLQKFVGLVGAVEPLIQETVTDLPFSYRFRVQGDRLILSNFRILLAGPNPGGKIGSAMLGDPAVIGCQVLGTALEGTYIASDGKEKPDNLKRPMFLRPRPRTEGKAH